MLFVSLSSSHHAHCGTAEEYTNKVLSCSKLSLIFVVAHHGFMSELSLVELTVSLLVYDLIRVQCARLLLFWSTNTSMFLVRILLGFIFNLSFLILPFINTFCKDFNMLCTKSRRAVPLHQSFVCLKKTFFLF